MAALAALSISEAISRLDALSAATPAPPLKDDLTAVFETLLATADGVVEPPRRLFEAAERLVSAAEPAVIESLPTRTRIVMRLLQLGLTDAAWAVLVDSATGVVSRAFHATTSSGANRTDWPLPLLTAIEPPDVYAELPGFRDPRYGVPDHAYDIGAAIKLRCHVEDVVPGRRPLFAGWAALDLLDTEPTESIAIVARHEGVELRWVGIRRRRADLLGGTRETLRRRAWAGWRVELDPAELSSAGRWTLWLEVGQKGVARRVRIGKSAGGLAERAVGTRLTRKPPVDLVQGNGGWSVLVVG